MTTEAGRRLTERHRLAQLRLGAVVVGQMRAAFAQLDPDDLDGTFPAWLAVATPIVQAARAGSGRLAAGYLAALRTFELGMTDPGPTVTAEPVNLAAVATSLLVCGPVSIRANRARGVPTARALDIAEARTAASAMRHSLAGGRETITETVRTDRRAVGWARVASGNACAFCTMLADRGAVFGEATADFEAHDGCGCSAEPVYR